VKWTHSSRAFALRFVTVPLQKQKLPRLRRERRACLCFDTIYEETSAKMSEEQRADARKLRPPVPELPAELPAEVTVPALLQTLDRWVLDQIPSLLPHSGGRGEGIVNELERLARELARIGAE
jgi:hypothetical protein